MEGYAKETALTLLFPVHLWPSALQELLCLQSSGTGVRLPGHVPISHSHPVFHLLSKTGGDKCPVGTVVEDRPL